MMGTILILATEVHEEGGFGLNLDIFETNLINLAILVGVLVYFGRKVLGQILSERRAKIAQAIQEAEARQKKAAATLAEQQQKLTQAQASAERIRKEAEERVKSAKDAIMAQAEKDIQRLRDTAAQDLSSEQDRVIAELRKRIAAMAMERAETQLKAQLNDSTQQTLIERSIAQLGGR
jgi:F-type H+-transporting ATPase subunit b